MTCGDRRYRVRGLHKNLSFDALKVNVMASREDGFHVDTLEMYAARQRQLFIRQAAEEMNVKEDVVKRDFGRLLLKLEELQDESVRQSLEPKNETVTLTDEEQQAALELLRDPNLLQRILTDYERCGVRHIMGTLSERPRPPAPAALRGPSSGLGPNVNSPTGPFIAASSLRGHGPCAARPAPRSAQAERQSGAAKE